MVKTWVDVTSRHQFRGRYPHFWRLLASQLESALISIGGSAFSQLEAALITLEVPSSPLEAATPQLEAVLIVTFGVFVTIGSSPHHI